MPLTLFIWDSDSPIRSFPSNRISPDSILPGSSMSLMTENPVTDFPPPDSPTMARISPSSTQKDTSSTALTVPLKV